MADTLHRTVLVYVLQSIDKHQAIALVPVAVTDSNEAKGNYGTSLGTTKTYVQSQIAEGGCRDRA